MFKILNSTEGLSKSSMRNGLLAVTIVSAVLIFVGGLLLGIFHLFVEDMVQKNLALAEGKDTFEKWKTTPIPVYFHVYLFNVTNPFEITQYGSKPIVKEVGPFVYKQMRSKEVLGWDHVKKTVTYNDIKSYIYDPTRSEDINMEIYMLNMPMMGMTTIENRVNRYLKGPLIGVLDQLLEDYNETLFVRRTAKQLLFDGYKVGLLEDLLGIVKPFVKIESPLPNNTFGFLYGKNNSGDGIFTVYTGEDDIAKYTQILEWNGASNLSYWKDEYCDMLNGTDGGQFSPPITENDVLYVFTAELCRSVYLTFSEEVEVKGILAYRFTTPTKLFESPEKNLDNTCYCTRKELCFLHGILDITACRKGVAIGVTGPHFLMGHDEFSERVDGMLPDAKLHSTYVDIEPNTGIVLRASRKLQMNYLLTKYDGFRQTSNAPDAVFPLLWLIEQAELDDHLADTFKSKVKTPVTVAKSILTACIVLGVLWIVTAGIVTGYILFKQQKSEAKKVKAQYSAVASNAGTENGASAEKYKPENA